MAVSVASTFVGFGAAERDLVIRAAESFRVLRVDAPETGGRVNVSHSIGRGTIHGFSLKK